MARQRQKASSSGGNWLTTYADLVTLLFAFFVLLYAFSVVEQEKFDSIAEALSAVLNGKGFELMDENPSQPTTEVITDYELVGETTVDIEKQDELVANLSELIHALNLEEYIDITVEKEAVSLSIRDVVVFDSGKASLKPESRTIMMEISRIFDEIDNEIIIEGHTDNVPINTEEFPSNWELSLARALTVKDFFVDISGLDESRFGVSGFAENKPITSNDTKEGRSENRRVNVLILFN